MQKSMPIVYISPYYDPNVHSGANHRFDEICKRLQVDYGKDLTLIVAKGKVPSWRGDCTLIEVEYNFDHASKFTAARQIARVLYRLPPSVVIMESIPIPFRALKRHHHFQTAYDFRYFQPFSKGFLYRLFFSRYLKHEWRNCEHIVTSSEFSIDELVRHVGYPHERIVKSYFGISEKLFDVPGQQTKLYDLIYVGHFDKHKNHAPLMEAIALLDKDLKVLFIGADNGLENSLKARAAELGLSNTAFMTVREDEKVWQYYTQSRLFVSPSLYEGFGMPTIEALALGLPAVVSDIPVFHEIGGDLVSYFDPKDPADIAVRISQVLAGGPPPTEKVRAHLEQFLWKNIYTKFVADLARLSGPSRTSTT